MSIMSPTDGNCDFTRWADFLNAQYVICAAKGERAKDICWVLCGEGKAGAAQEERAR